MVSFINKYKILLTICCASREIKHLRMCYYQKHYRLLDGYSNSTSHWAALLQPIVDYFPTFFMVEHTPD